MINIFFVPGMFGSTLEYMLRNFTQNFNKVNGHITEDGSLHSFDKEFHPETGDMTQQFFQRFIPDIAITTPIYPMPDEKLSGIIAKWPGDLSTSKNIFIHANAIEDAELNILFQYYKISKGVLQHGLGIFCGDNTHNIVNWNENYQSWRQMQPWELREWLSLFYREWINEWIHINDDIKSIDQKLVLGNTDILNNLEDAFLKIVDYCGLTPTMTHDSFVTEWTAKQQYILDEFYLIQKIIQNTLDQQYFKWSKEQLCFLSESIIQARLRLLGYEIKCYNLNEFPTNSLDLHSILEKL